MPFPALFSPATTRAAATALHAQRLDQTGAQSRGASPPTARRSGAVPNAANRVPSGSSISATHPTIRMVHRAAREGRVLTISGTGFTHDSGAIIAFALRYSEGSSVRNTVPIVPTDVYTSTIPTSTTGRVTISALNTCWTMSAHVSIADSASHHGTSTIDVPACSASTYASQPIPANAMEAISLVRPSAPDVCDFNAAQPYLSSVSFGGEPYAQGAIPVMAVGFAAKQHVHFHVSGGDFGTLDVADVADDLGILIAQRALSNS